MLISGASKQGPPSGDKGLAISAGEKDFNGDLGSSADDKRKNVYPRSVLPAVPSVPVLASRRKEKLCSWSSL